MHYTWHAISPWMRHNGVYFDLEAGYVLYAANIASFFDKDCWTDKVKVNFHRWEAGQFWTKQIVPDQLLHEKAVMSARTMPYERSLHTHCPNLTHWLVDFARDTEA